MSLEAFDLMMPRNAFSVRDAARAGDVWRTFQDAAVLGSSRRGWPPQRYVAEQCAFVVRKQTVVHLREIQFGELLHAETWVEQFKRGLFSTRQTRLSVGGERVAAATQDWVHVAHVDGAMRATRASDALLESFQEMEVEPIVELPAYTPVEGRPFTFSFDVWFTTMDPLDHANHPAYVDWCDEALARVAVAAGLAPVDVVPIADQVRFKAGVLGGERVDLEGQLIGRTSRGEAVLRFSIRVNGKLRADAVLVRSTVHSPAPLVVALQGD